MVSKVPPLHLINILSDHLSYKLMIPKLIFNYYAEEATFRGPF